MSFEPHIKPVTHSYFFYLRNIAKLRTIVSKGELEMLVHASISFWLDYCKVLFSYMSKASLHHLQAVQNAINSLISPCTGYWLVTDISIKSSVLRLCLYEVRHPLTALSGRRTGKKSQIFR